MKNKKRSCPLPVVMPPGPHGTGNSVVGASGFKFMPEGQATSGPASRRKPQALLASFPIGTKPATGNVTVWGGSLPVTVDAKASVTGKGKHSDRPCMDCYG